MKRLSAFALSHSPVLSFDPAFALFAKHPRKELGRKLVLIPRTNSGSTFFGEVAKKMTEGFTDVRVLLMQPEAAERRVGERLCRLCGAKTTVVELASVQQFLDEVSAASEVLSQRYHGALAAFAMGITAMAVPQETGDKMDSLNGLMRKASARDELLQSVKRGADGLRQAIRSVSSL